MSKLSDVLQLALRRKKASRAIHAALVSGRVAEIEGEGGKRYLVFSSEAAGKIRPRAKGAHPKPVVAS